MTANAASDEELLQVTGEAFDANPRLTSRALAQVMRSRGIKGSSTRMLAAYQRVKNARYPELGDAALIPERHRTAQDLVQPPVVSLDDLPAELIARIDVAATNYRELVVEATVTLHASAMRVVSERRARYIEAEARTRAEITELVEERQQWDAELQDAVREASEQRRLAVERGLQIDTLTLEMSDAKLVAHAMTSDLRALRERLSETEEDMLRLIGESSALLASLEVERRHLQNAESEIARRSDEMSRLHQEIGSLQTERDLAKREGEELRRQLGETRVDLGSK